MSLWQMDVCNAFLNAPLPDDTPVCMYAPKGYERPEQVIRLCKALYGLKQSPRQWFDTFKSFLCSKPLSLRQCPVDACLFMLVGGGVVVLLVGIHVDDLVLVGVDSHLQWLRTALLREFTMEDIGHPTCVLGWMDIDLRSDGSIHLFQCSYITKLQHRFNVEDCKSENTPMSSTVRFTKDDCTKPGDTPPSFPYRELVACLLFVSISTRPVVTVWSWKYNAGLYDYWQQETTLSWREPFISMDSGTQKS